MKHKHIFILIILLIPLGVFSQDFFTLSGKITDSKTGKTLDGIDIVVKDEITGTISNYTGCYLLHLDKGSYNITYSGKGYSKEEITINLNDDQVQMIELSPKKKTFKRKHLTPKETKTEELLSVNTQN